MDKNTNINFFINTNSMTYVAIKEFFKQEIINYEKIGGFIKNEKYTPNPDLYIIYESERKNTFNLNNNFYIFNLSILENMLDNSEIISDNSDFDTNSDFGEELFK